MASLPSRGPNSPFSAGSRTLVARTCIRCGKLADGDSFPLINKGAGGRRKTCHHCTNARKKQDREERGIGLPRPPEAQQTSKWQRWSAEDDRYLREHIEGQSYEDIAVALGRSVRSVYKRREVLGLPPVRVRHRVAQPWKIEKEN